MLALVAIVVIGVATILAIAVEDAIVMPTVTTATTPIIPANTFFYGSECYYTDYDHNSEYIGRYIWN